jgi:hypothetical protein
VGSAGIVVVVVVDVVVVTIVMTTGTGLVASTLLVGVGVELTGVADSVCGGTVDDGAFATEMICEIAAGA